MRFKVANYSRLEIRLDTLHIYIFRQTTDTVRATHGLLSNARPVSYCYCCMCVVCRYSALSGGAGVDISEGRNRSVGRSAGGGSSSLYQGRLSGPGSRSSLTPRSSQERNVDAPVVTAATRYLVVMLSLCITLHTVMPFILLYITLPTIMVYIIFVIIISVYIIFVELTE